MRLNGGIHLDGDGICSTVSSMILIQNVTSIINDNVAGYNKVGYQRKVPVISSFAEFIGPHAVSENKDEEIGRIKITKNPLDFVLACKGYFQTQTPNGIKLTRDGRFKLDKDGNLLTLENHKVLSRDGAPIKFEKIPRSVDDIRITKDGLIQFKDAEKLKIHNIGFISAVSADGERIKNVSVKQGYIEESNVSLPEEVFNVLPLRRSFTVNRELFKIQNEALTKLLQELGKV
ncbi:MAG TPA: flagellar basal body rod C-terminal domain-containing protein [Candidatus Gastranaerophilales bacterium]|nr:flagellar basal body rod C-terminal domain-containing protein [Candidatus Gastranaerophilales bacterium]